LATRTQAREAVVALLYSIEVGNFDAEKHIDVILEDKKIRNKQREFVLELIAGIKLHLGALDELIRKYISEDNGFDKIGLVEKSILRVATYEMLYSEVDKIVIINEAIEIAKRLGSESSSRFVNGVLESIKNDKGL
jgi:transcription antitermination protein NusB